jgi:peptide/nickel transport system substrate-binding protein
LLPPPSTAQAQVKALQGNPQVVIHQDNFMESSFVRMNISVKPFTDKRVRLALNYATDKQALIDKILFGYGKPSGQALPIMFGYDPSIQAYPYDPQKAKELLKAAGYGKGVSFTMLANAQGSLQLEQALQQQWKQVGVNASIQTVNVNTEDVMIQVAKPKYQINTTYMTSDIIDPDELVSFAIAGNGGTLAIWSMYNNKTVNDLAAKGAQTLDRAQRQKIYYELARIHHDDAPLVFLYTQPSLSLTTPAVQGFKVLPTGNFRLEKVWLSS